MKNRILRYRFFLWSVSGLVLIFLQQGCYEEAEGCLDAAANNFDVSADLPCGDCCRYPSLQLKFQHEAAVNDTFLTLVLQDSVYPDGAGNLFRLKNIQFYLSYLHLIADDGLEATVEETVEMDIAGQGPQVFEDNFALIDPAISSSLNMGTFRASGHFSFVRFAVGVEGLANNADATSLPDDHPLAEDRGLFLGPDAGYAFCRLEFYRDTASVNAIPVVIDISGNESLAEVVLPVDYAVVEGFDSELTLGVDYLSWFSEVDVQNDTEASVAEKIASRLADSFRLIDLKAK